MNGVAAATDVTLFFLGSAKSLDDAPSARTALAGGPFN
jgi:hypothetical protein